MMSSNKFAARSPADVLRLVLQQPLMWVVSGTGEKFRSTLLPVRPETDTEGRVTRLVGHFARSNDQAQLLQQDPRAAMLVLGTHGYISPSWMNDKSQAPTWNYASAQFLVDVEFFEAPAQLEAHLRDLVDAMETHTPRDPAHRPWDVDQMGPRYASLSRGVIGFSARVREVRARFKLGQDERDDVFRDIMTGLTHSDADEAGELASWMNDFNPGRL